MSATIWGKIRKGKSRGKMLGFPTANIKLHKKISEGIYISKTRVERTWWPSLTFIGTAKTFHESLFQAEVYIFDYNSQIYGKWITNLLLKKIRDSIKFSSVKELVNQMKNDEKAARKYFKNYSEEV